MFPPSYHNTQNPTHLHWAWATHHRWESQPIIGELEQPTPLPNPCRAHARICPPWQRDVMRKRGCCGEGERRWKTQEIKREKVRFIYGLIKNYYLVLQLCYSVILHLGWHYSTIAKNICNFGILQVRLPTSFCALIVLSPYISHLQAQL